MKLIRRFLGPSQSILISFDHLAGDSALSFEDQIEEVSRYYRFSKLSEIVTPSKNVQGRAAIVFPQARKSIFLRAVPYLLGREIPFTLFLHPDSIGLNRLPLSEEIQIYREHYPEQFPHQSYEHWMSTAWSHPAEAESFLGECRRKIGPLPLNALDPTRFFVTWGKILEVPPRFLEAGLYLATSPLNRERVRAAVEFIRSQLKRSPRMALCTLPSGLDTSEIDALKQLGIEGSLMSCEGAVERDTSAWKLPLWPMHSLESSSRL